jgi:hypothetical protein
VALEHWQRALALRQSAGDDSRTRTARWTVARGLRSLGRYDEAEAIQRALARETDEARAPDGYVYEELAEIALARGDRAGTAGFALRAHALLAAEPGFAAREPDRLARLARLATGGVAR